MKKACLAGAAALALVSAPASGATPITNANGILTGATGVEVSGQFYDVEFVEGTFAEVYTDGSYFDGLQFASAGLSGGIAAAQALFDQVFIGEFDIDPGLTNGCGHYALCQAFTPIALSQTVEWDDFNGEYVYRNVIVSVAAYNWDQARIYEGLGGSYLQDDEVSYAEVTYSLDTTPVDQWTWARFSVAGTITSPPVTAAVPEPAAWLMLLLGFFSIGGALRRGREKTLPQFFNS